MENESKNTPKYYNSQRATMYREYRNTYIKENVKQVLLRYNRKLDVDQQIIEYLESQRNTTAYISRLIMQDMNNHGYNIDIPNTKYAEEVEKKPGYSFEGNKEKAREKVNLRLAKENEKSEEE